MVKMFYSLLGTAVIGYGIAVMFIAQFQEHLVYFPSKEITHTPADIGLAYNTVRFKNREGLFLNGWFIPHSKSDTVVLYCYGNGGNISHRLMPIDLLHAMGLSVFIFDYRGYGESEGKADEEGTYQDAQAAWEQLISMGYKPHNIILYGQSLGGAVAAYIASVREPKALILEGAFTDITALVKEHYFFLPVGLISRYRYDTASYLQKTHTPVLIIHSEQDEVVPYWHGQKLFLTAHEPKTMLTIQGGHNTALLESQESYMQGVSAFLKELSLKKD